MIFVAGGNGVVFVVGVVSVAGVVEEVYVIVVGVASVTGVVEEVFVVVVSVVGVDGKVGVVKGVGEKIFFKVFTVFSWFYLGIDFEDLVGVIGIVD